MIARAGLDLVELGDELLGDTLLDALVLDASAFDPQPEPRDATRARPGRTNAPSGGGAPTVADAGPAGPQAGPREGLHVGGEP